MIRQIAHPCSRRRSTLTASAAAVPESPTIDRRLYLIPAQEERSDGLERERHDTQRGPDRHHGQRRGALGQPPEETASLSGAVLYLKAELVRNNIYNADGAASI